MSNPVIKQPKAAKRPLFSIRARLKSFRYAWDGMREFFAWQHNAIIHAVATLVVIVLGILTKLHSTEWIFISIVTGLVWMAELFNTAIEKLCDLVSPGFNPKVKFIKDVTAAAVLVSAIIAAITGLIIFIPKLL
jgi:diacylglycerol kinase